MREGRSDGVRGGITIIAASAPDLIPDVTEAETPDVCPVELTGRPVWSDTIDGAQQRRSVPDNSAGFLLAEVRNASPDPLDDLEVWLESHCIAEAQVEPLVFQSVRLDAGETIRAAWPIVLGAPPSGRYVASLVATSARHAPHRLLVDVRDRPGPPGPARRSVALVARRCSRRDVAVRSTLA